VTVAAETLFAERSLTRRRVVIIDVPLGSGPRQMKTVEWIYVGARPVAWNYD